MLVSSSWASSSCRARPAHLHGHATGGMHALPSRQMVAVTHLAGEKVGDAGAAQGVTHAYLLCVWSVGGRCAVLKSKRAAIIKK